MINIVLEFGICFPAISTLEFGFFLLEFPPWNLEFLNLEFVNQQQPAPGAQHFSSNGLRAKTVMLLMPVSPCLKALISSGER
jgi:hypothetical protein